MPIRAFAPHFRSSSGDQPIEPRVVRGFSPGLGACPAVRPVDLLVRHGGATKYLFSIDSEAQVMTVGHLHASGEPRVETLAGQAFEEALTTLEVVLPDGTGTRPIDLPAEVRRAEAIGRHAALVAHLLPALADLLCDPGDPDARGELPGQAQTLADSLTP